MKVLKVFYKVKIIDNMVSTHQQDSFNASPHAFFHIAVKRKQIKVIIFLDYMKTNGNNNDTKQPKYENCDI